MEKELRELGLRNIHADYIAAVILGDIHAETIIFGTDADAARREAIACGMQIYAINETQMSSDVVERAWDFVKGWLVSNEHRFSPDASPYYGRQTRSPGGHNDEYFVIPQYLDKALEDAGFNVKKTFQGLRERGYITTQKDSEGKVRTKTLGRLGDNVLRGYLFQLDSHGIRPLNGSVRENG